MERKRGINVSNTLTDMKNEIRLKKLYEQKDKLKKLSDIEKQYKSEIENAGRVSYFTEVFENIPLENQNPEIEGYGDPRTSVIFDKGREIAERLVRNNIANMENYADFCKVETSKTRKGR